jgi:hypothetical protein
VSLYFASRSSDLDRLNNRIAPLPHQRSEIKPTGPGKQLHVFVDWSNVCTAPQSCWSFRFELRFSYSEVKKQRVRDFHAFIKLVGGTCSSYLIVAALLSKAVSVWSEPSPAPILASISKQSQRKLFCHTSSSIEISKAT